MEYAIRTARPGDADAIASFTQDTFDWGDYVSDVFSEWIGDDNGRVMVAVDSDDTAIAMSRGVMLSDTELWLQGARVSEPWRRRGIATGLGESLIEWGEARGAQIARLLTEGWNGPAQLQVEQSGFHRAGDWVMAWRAISEQQPVIGGNGGQRAKAHRKLEIAHSSEALPAWVSWRSGPLVQPAHGLYTDGWRWSRLLAEHLEHAGRHGRLWTSQAGWLVTRPDAESLYVEWLECGPEDIDDMLRAVMDLATDAGVAEVRIIVPDVDWLSVALQQAGFELGTLYLYERYLHGGLG